MKNPAHGLLWLAMIAPLAGLAPLAGCGSEEAAPAVEPPEEPATNDVPAEPVPEPEPPPPPLAECPEDTWAVGARDYRPAPDGRTAAELVRDVARGSWQRVSVCRTTPDGEIHLICGPSANGRGAECNLGLPGRVCSATLPAPVLPVAAGTIVDTSAPPEGSEWHCSRAR
ncbi:MAG: hypothetical protein AB7S26_12315 [Sandaracinaceae bacterium]